MSAEALKIRKQNVCRWQVMGCCGLYDSAMNFSDSSLYGIVCARKNSLGSACMLAPEVSVVG